MKRSKKILSIFLTMSLCITLFTGLSVSAAKKSSPDKIVFAFLTFNNIPTDTTAVEKAINAITVPKINVEVKLKPLSISNYSQQINLALQSGEQLDIFHSIGDINQYISKKEVIPVDDLLNKYGSETKKIVGDNFLKVAKSNGKTYGIPADKGYAIFPNFIYRADILKSIGVAPSSIKTINDVSSVLAKVKAKYPNMIPLAASTGSTGALQTIGKVDFLTDDLFKPTAVLIGDNLRVVDFYETPEFKLKINLMRDWYEKGYIAKDASTTTSSTTELMSSGRAFSYIGSYAGNYAAVQISGQTGQKIGAVRIGKSYLSTTSINALTWAITATCKNPAAAMKFLNLTFTNKDIINLIIWGIEGQDYVKTDAVHVKYPAGKDANTVPYTAAFSCGIVGNQFLQYMADGSDSNDMNTMARENKMAQTSKAFGFTFDSSSVKTEYAAVMNVINQYLPGLYCGSLDPKTELPKFIKALKDAGMDAIVKEKQKQLDVWAKLNKVK